MQILLSLENRSSLELGTRRLCQSSRAGSGTSFSSLNGNALLRLCKSVAHSPCCVSSGIHCCKQHHDLVSLMGSCTWPSASACLLSSPALESGLGQDPHYPFPVIPQFWVLHATIKDSVLFCKSWMQFHKEKKKKHSIVLPQNKQNITCPLCVLCAWVGEKEEEETFLSSFLYYMLNYKLNGNPTHQGSHEVTLFLFPSSTGHSNGIRKNMW